MSIKNITRAKQAEAALQESEEFNSSLLNNSPNPIMVINPDISIRYVNPALEQLTGFTAAELIGIKPPYPYWIRRKKPKELMLIKSAIRGSGIKKLENRFQKKNGELFWVEITSKPVRRDGELQYYLANWVDITGRKKVEEELLNSKKELESSREELRNLSSHLVSVREQERSRIALDIHHNLGQMLAALKMDVSWLKKKIPEAQLALREKAGSMLKEIDMTIQSVRRISAELRPHVLDNLGLAVAIEWQAQEFQKITGIKCEVICNPEEIVLDCDSSTTVFRILQESLTNIFHHAGATRVTVRLVEQAASIVLKVRDNGKGITKENISDPKAFGLIGMRERARSVGGELEVRGLNGKGTTITLRVPLEKEKLC